MIWGISTLKSSYIAKSLLHFEQTPYIVATVGTNRREWLHLYCWISLICLKSKYPDKCGVSLEVVPQGYATPSLYALAVCSCTNTLSLLMQVLSDGAITFDRPIALYQPMTFPLEGDLVNFQLVAPFLADHDPRKFGLVRYKVYSRPNENTRVVSEFIKNKNFSSNFVGTWMLVAEWYRVPLYPASDANIVSGN